MGLFGKHKDNKKVEVSSNAPSMPPLAAAPSDAGSETRGQVIAPPVPVNGFDDIKSQVMGNGEENKNDESSLNSNENISFDKESEKENFEVNDSLFDFSDVSSDSDLHEIPSESNVVDTNNQNMSNLNFVENSSSHSHISKEDSYFVTTAQFKTLLEIVESVKERVKNSNETHLRLLDIKSEEDIEYENLRKDFQFIEDKLYELDSIIFEK